MDDRQECARPLCMVLAEDHELFRTTVCEFIASLGGVGIPALASDGNAALQLCREQNPDIALIDVNLGKGPNGCEVAKALCTELPDCCTILYTGNDTGWYRDLLGTVPVEAFIAKENLFEQLPRILSKIAQRRTN